jgi:uncharacterized protein YecE (DUF72 family)
MRRITSLIILLILASLFTSACERDKVNSDEISSLSISKDNVINGKIPFLPISANDILYIGLYGYSEKEQHSNNRNATNEEKNEIINWLNNIKNYESEIKTPKYNNGKPEPSNIQIFTKDSVDTNFMYILEKDDGYIMISRPQSGTGYIVKQSELNNLLKQLRK